MGLVKAFTFIKKQTTFTKEEIDQIPFTTMGNLVTAILTELRKGYVHGESPTDRKMRNRIIKTISLINNYQEMSNMIIKRNPFHHHRKREQEDSQVGPQNNNN